MLIYHGQFRTNPLLKTKGESWAKKGLYIAQREDDDRQKSHHMEVQRLGDHPFNHDVDHRGSHWYGCRHIQLNGDCGIYETRPDMCRRYPNGSPCQFEGCTMSEEEQQKHFDEHWPGRKLKRDDFVQELSESIAALPDKAIKTTLIDPGKLTKKVRAKR